MGAEHSQHHWEKSNPNSTSLDVEQSEEATVINQSDVLARGKLVEMEVEAAQLRETLKVLDTKCEVLKYENKYLRGQVINLKEKVEMLENANKGEELELKVVCLEMNNFEKRITNLESQIKVDLSPSPQIPKKVSTTTFTPSEVYKSCSEVYKSSVQLGICQDKNPPTKKEKDNACINTSNQRGVSSAKHDKLHKYYDHPLPENLVQLCTVTRCGLCFKNLASQLLASEHYWSMKHFVELEAYLDKRFKNTPQLKPNFKSSLFYSRPLPKAIISKCSKEKCGLCNVIFSGTCNKLAKDHYYGSEHNKEILKFLQKNTEHWQEGLVNTSSGGSKSQKAASNESKKTPKSVAAPPSWLPSLSQSVPAEIRSKFKQDCCELCQVAGFTGEPVARGHYKGRKHTANVENLLKLKDTTENLLDLSEDFLDFGDEVMLSDNTKEVITVSESCSSPRLDPVFIGIDTIKEGKGNVESVVIINQEGSILLDQIVPTNECEDDLVTEKVLDHIKVQLILKEVFKDKLLVGYDLSNTLKVLNLDHPEHLSLDIRHTFSEIVPGVKPSLKLIVFKFLEKLEYEHSRSNEAQVTMEIFKKLGKKLKMKATQDVECRILMSKSAMEALRKKGILKEVKRPEVLFNVPLVGGIVSIFAADIGSLSKALHDLLQLMDYPKLASELKMIVPCGLPVKKKDFLARNVSMYGKRLPMSKEKVVGFGGVVLEMISGVEHCLLMMEKNKEFCSYGGPGSRYDYSDHDGQIAAMCGDWDDDSADVPVQENVECCSCQVLGLQHFSGTQLKRGEARRCYSCVCS